MNHLKQLGILSFHKDTLAYLITKALWENLNREEYDKQKLFDRLLAPFKDIADYRQHSKPNSQLHLPAHTISGIPAPASISLNAHPLTKSI